MSLQWVRNPSLEFSWLPNSLRKGIPTPRLVISSDDRYGGLYLHRTPERCVVTEMDVDLKEGAVIALCQSRNAGTLAHEYRHHWQVNSGYHLGSSVFESPCTMDAYRKAIIRYFRTYWWEWDALRFQLKHAPCETSQLWKEWLVA